MVPITVNGTPRIVTVFPIGEAPSGKRFRTTVCPSTQTFEALSVSFCEKKTPSSTRQSRIKVYVGATPASEVCQLF